MMALNQSQGKPRPKVTAKPQRKPATKDEAVQQMAQENPERVARMLREFLRQRGN